jgi:hypothetical protein
MKARIGQNGQKYFDYGTKIVAIAAGTGTGYLAWRH